MKARRRQLFIALVAAAAASGAWPAHAQTLYTCGDGTVRAVQSRVQIVPPAVAPVSVAWGEGGAGLDTPTSEKRMEYVVTVRLDARDYTARASADAPWNLDPREFAKDEHVQVCTNGRQLVLDRLDGTDFRAAIVGVTSRGAAASDRP